MNGENNLQTLIKSMRPILNEGEYIFYTLPESATIDLNDVLCFFKEKEGNTIIISKKVADEKGFEYTFVASWITLTVHSALEAVGLTAAFSTALGEANISCNVVAAYYHDHIFVATKDAQKAMKVLEDLSK